MSGKIKLVNKIDKNTKKVGRSCDTKPNAIKQGLSLKEINLEKENLSPFKNDHRSENLNFWKKKFQIVFQEKLSLENELSRKNNQINQLLDVYIYNFYLIINIIF